MMIQPLERRLLLALTVDPTFGLAGRVAPALGEVQSPQIGFMQRLSDGKIVIGGTTGGGVRVARYLPGGQPDTTFGGGDGFSDVINVPGVGNVIGGAIQSDGKILLGHNRDLGFAVTRFNADGTLDTAFGGGDGIAQTPPFQDAVIDPAARAIGLAADGKIIVAGMQDESIMTVVRFNTDGTLDTGFDTDGIATLPGVDAFVQDATVLADGRVVVLGVDQDSDEQMLVQFTSAGAADTSFDADGVRRFQFGSVAVGDFATAVIADGTKIVVGGSNDGDDDVSIRGKAAIARFNADGSFDTTFGGGDGVAYTGENAAHVRHLVIDSQNRYLGNTNDGKFVRWSNAGVPDVTLGAGGVAAGAWLNALALTADGKILSAGDNLIERFTEAADPRPEFSLAENGTLFITNTTGNNTITIAQSGSNLAVTRNGTATNFVAADVLGLDILLGGGNDTVNVSVDRRANVVLGDGTNTLVLGDGLHTITGGAGADDITVGDGDENQETVIDTAGGNDEVTVANGRHEIFTGAGDDVVLAGDGNKSVNAGDGNDSVTVGDGGGFFNGTEIQGGNGNDTITTGAGNDTIFGGPGSDSITAGGGDDLVHAGLNNAGGGDNTEENVVHGGDGRDTIFGSDGRDSLYGGANPDFIHGYNHSDLISGGGGRDKISGDAGRDRIYGGAGSDLLAGGTWDDRIAGQSGDDFIYDQIGADSYIGDAGNDNFFGSADGDIDTLDGGSGDNVATGFEEADEILNATRTA